MTVKAQKVTRDEAVHVAHAMKRYGGGFVGSLANCIIRADENNLQKLYNAFPEYWAKYLGFYNVLGVGED